MEDLYRIKASEVNYNLSVPKLVEMALKRGEASLGIGGSILVNTGRFTGRSPKDKFIVGNSDASGDIWTEVNSLMPQDCFERLWQDMQDHISKQSVFVQDLAAGAEPDYQVNIRVVTEFAWHSLFIHHLLRKSIKKGDLEYLIVNCPSFLANPERHGCRSTNVVAINFEQRIVLIAGSGYAGEIKKSVFTLLNRILPEQGIVSMHCSANHAIGNPDSTAIFFGLSGTGKTTLSSSSDRVLIGDDEHAWSNSGIFNIEGGCYAKTLNLDPVAEPDIYRTTSKFATIIENMVFDPDSCELDFADSTITENTRCAYPLESINMSSSSGMAGHPKNVFMLTCDAYGVLPPISRLSSAQAMYHFLSGFTSKVAGTEQGISEPEPVFSACFGSPFLPLKPEVYGKLLRDRIETNNSDCWLVNTGWTGGSFGVGQRMPIEFTRALLNSALSGQLVKKEFSREEAFGLEIPIAVQGVPHHLLLPQRSWQDHSAYDRTANHVKSLFEDNFRQYEGFVEEDILVAGVGGRPN